MWKEILAGIGICVMSFGTGREAYQNCKAQIASYAPQVEQNLALTKKEFENGNYNGVRELIAERQNLAIQIERTTGMYELFFPEGREIHKRFRESIKLEEALSFLR